MFDEDEDVNEDAYDAIAIDTILKDVNKRWNIFDQDIKEHLFKI